MPSIATRFRPVRAGILNLWHFRDVVLPFADGRLVLRGDNGSGKTLALELLFPLVLDGSLDPRRLDPFGGDGRGMRGKLLAAAQANGHSAAVGYAWLTFARTTESGREEHVTVGIGVHGSESRDDVDSWTFVTPRQPGVDLQLLDDERRPLSKRLLREALGPDAVHVTLSAHRRAVDHALFGLGEDRYAAMLDLVLQLRKPKLATALDPEQASDLLSRGLRPVDGDAITAVADGLADIERIADELKRMRETSEALAQLHVDYGSYLRAHARRRLDALDGARNELRDKIEAVRTAEGIAREATEAAEREEHGAREARTEAERARGRAEGLRASEAYKTRQALDDRRVRVATQQRLAKERRAASDRAHGRREEASKEARTKADAAVALEAEIRDAARRLSESAETSVRLVDVDFSGDATALRTRAKAAIATRKHEIDEVESVLSAHDKAVVRVTEAEEQVDKASTRLTAARSAKELAVDDTMRERDALLRALSTWAASHPVLTDAEGATLEARAADGGRDEVREIPHAFATTVRPRREALAVDRRNAEVARDHAKTDLVELRRTRARIASEEDDAPNGSPWRTANRDGRPGAPLWRLVDFRPELARDQRAGVEGALLAAGLLDAWVDPDGIQRAVPDDDAFLVPARAADGPSLADVLLPEPQERVGAERIMAVLRSVPLGRLAELPVTVDTSGRFRLGPLHGALRVADARFIGATARQTERKRRIAAIDVDIERATATLDSREGALESVELQIAAMDRASAHLPDVGPLVGRLDAERARTRDLESATDHLHDQQATHDRRRRELSEATHRLRSTAAERQLPTELRALRSVRRRVDDFERDADLQARRLDALPHRTREAGEARAKLERETEDADRMRGQAETAEREAESEAEALKAIEDARGADIQRVLSEIDHAVVDEKAAAARADAHTKRAGEHRTIAGGESARADVMRADIPRLRAAEDRAHRQVSIFARPAFATSLGIATAEGSGSSVDGGPSALEVALGRAAGDASATDQNLSARRTIFEKRFGELQRVLGGRLRATLDEEDGLKLVEIDDEGRQPSAVYAEALDRRLRDQATMLADAERRVFEDHLLGTLCGALFARIGTASGFASHADRELRRRALSSGVRFGLDWRPRQDISPSAAAMLAVLRRDPDHLGPTELDRVRQALRTSLAELREQQPQADHRSLLEAALDYRAWHEFRILLLRPGQGAEQLTKHRYSQLSGAEKASALYAPLFAAARATFLGGASHAPRLVALDEAFEGIDPNGRPEMLAITVAFELDLLLTGYDLWLTDRTVPEAMHANVVHDDAERLAIVDLVAWRAGALEDVDSPLSYREVG